MFDNNKRIDLACSVRNRDLGYGIFVSTSIFLICILLKLDFIHDQILIADDIELPWRIREEGLTNPLPGRPVGSFIYYITAMVFPNISYQMVFYLIVLSVTALILFLLFYEIFSCSWLLSVGILFAFTSPAVTSAGNFTSGSHGVLGLLFGSIGLLFSYHSISSDLSYPKRIALALSASVFFIFAALTSTYFYVFFFAGLLWMLTLRNKFYYKRIMWTVVAIALVPIVTLLLYKLTAGSIHPYDRIIGWADFKFAYLSGRVFGYIVYIANLYIKNMPDPLVLCVAMIVGALLSWLALKMSLRYAPPSSRLRSESNEEKLGISGVLVLLLGCVLTLIPALPITWGWSPRHVYTSMILAVLAAFAIVDLALSRYRIRFTNNKWIVVLFAGLLLGYNFSVTWSHTNHNYGSLLAYQPMVKRFIEKEKENWPKGAQIIIASDIPSHFTFGLNHWSTFYLRTITGDKTLFGLIGKEAYMVEHEDLFVDSYRHWSESYWKVVEVNGRPTSRLRQMFGIVQQAPTYAYRFNAVDGVAQRVHWLLVNASDSWRLYRITDAGIVLRRRGASVATLADLTRSGIDRKDVFVYGRPIK